MCLIINFSMIDMKRITRCVFIIIIIYVFLFLPSGEKIPRAKNLAKNVRMAVSLVHIKNNGNNNNNNNRQT